MSKDEITKRSLVQFRTFRNCRVIWIGTDTIVIKTKNGTSFVVDRSELKLED